MNCESAAGGSEFHLSLRDIGMITSLMSGLPSRETWIQGPVSASVEPTRMRDLRRLAEAYTPITDFASPTLDGIDRSRVSCVLGTWIAIVWMLRFLVASTPGAAAVGM